MGRIVSFNCKKCGYEANLWIGAGMTYNSLDNVITLFDKKTQEMIKDAISKYPHGNWDIRKEIGICEKCGKISAVAVFNLTTDNKVTITYKAKCPCGGEVEIVDAGKVLDGQITLSCPHCQEALEAAVTGHWD